MNTLRALLVASLLLVLAPLPRAQVIIGPLDIPTEPGTISNYFVETDTGGVLVPVNVGNPGADQFYDFTQGSEADPQTEELFAPEDTPYFNLFPTANRVSFGPVPYGLADGTSWRYDEISANAWTVKGITLLIDQVGDFPIPIDVPLLELPLDYGDSWPIDVYREVTIPVELIPYPIPIFDEIRIEVTITGGNVADGWGTVSVPGGEVDVLRVFTQIGGHADAVGIYYLFGFPIEVPLGTVYTVPTSLAYSWYSPGIGEAAFALSQPGETDPNFTQATLVRRVNLGGETGSLTLTATPHNTPILIPVQGGSFSWGLQLDSTYPTPFAGNLWTVATLPNNNQYLVQLVGGTLPPNFSILIPNLVQQVPGFAPAGIYQFTAYVGVYPNQIEAQDGFPFAKQAAGANRGAEVCTWNSIGLERALGGSVAAASAEPVVSPSEFALGAAYPNPFNPATTLSLSLPEATQLEVAVYDALGRRVATLAQGVYSAGQHSLTFDGSGFASGVYFVQANIPGRLDQVQKIALMK